MFYLEYENDTKIVVEIHEQYPEEVRENCSIAKSDQFSLGMELEYVITVDKVNQEGEVIASSTTRQTTPAYQLLKKMDEKNKEIDRLNENIALLEGSVFELTQLISILGGDN